MNRDELTLTQGVIRDGYPFALGWLMSAVNHAELTGDMSGLPRTVDVIERALEARDAAQRADLRAAIDSLPELTAGSPS